MKYHVTGIINDKFLSECYEAANEKQAEQKLKQYGYKLYAGEVTIIRTVEEAEWQELLRQLSKRKA